MVNSFVVDTNSTILIFSQANFNDFILAPIESKTIIFSQSFIFPEYSWAKEQKMILSIDFDSFLGKRQSEKKQITQLIRNRKPVFQDDQYVQVLVKCLQTMQNNWRIPAGEVKHAGLFPSYHYEWLHGFWAWDSWKQAVGLSYYDTELAKEQMKLMFNFQNEDGFVLDCVFRDTLVERHNYRDT